jgi:hemerythrin-like domain-containing protein
MNPLEELRHEHAVISLVLRYIGQEAQRIEDIGTLRPEVVEMMLDFSRNFTDRCHHAKEENHLFPSLEGKGMSRESGLVADLLNEHAEGRRRLKAVDELLPAAGSGDKDAALSVALNLFAYRKLLEEHIAREDTVLFPMADSLLSAEDQDSLEKAFARVEEIETGLGVHEKYHRLAHTIAEQFGPE